MVSKELKRLSRRELVDVIYQLKKNEQQMVEELESLREEVQEKRIRHSVAGSIADAAVSVTNLLATAQTTADLYLHEISYMKEQTKLECAQMINQANETVVHLLAEGEKKNAQLQAQYEQTYKQLQALQEELKKSRE